MYRRKKKGMGIVLEKTDDIIESAQIGATFEEVHTKLLQLEKDYNGRTKYKRELREQAIRPELISACLLLATENLFFVFDNRDVCIRVCNELESKYFYSSNICKLNF